MHWINIKDNIPEDKERVLVCLEDVVIAKFYKGDRNNKQSFIYKNKTISPILWMPLPNKEL